MVTLYLKCIRETICYNVWRIWNINRKNIYIMCSMKCKHISITFIVFFVTDAFLQDFLLTYMVFMDDFALSTAITN